MNQQRAARLDAAVRRIKPGIITNNRLGGGFDGDTETSEQHIPPQGYPGRDWETCMTMNSTWGYKHWDHEWKSTGTLICNLIDIASKGGNYLLNVGPDGLGGIPAPSVQSLEAIGGWMKVNGEAIYGTGPTAFGPECGAFHPEKRTSTASPRSKPSGIGAAPPDPGKSTFIYSNGPPVDSRLMG